MPRHRQIDFDMAGIATVLSQERFRVPTYQRSYAWDTEEIENFWIDLRTALNAEELDYFLGSIVLTDGQDGQVGQKIVIDGQQRLATTCLFLAAQRDLHVERGEQDHADEVTRKYLLTFDRDNNRREPRLVLNEDDDEFFRALITEGIPAEAPKESHQRLSSAYTSLKERLRTDIAEHGQQSLQRLTKWSRFFDENAAVIAVKVPTESEAFVIFETLNDRGAPLTIGDLLKNFLFMRAGNRIEVVKQNWLLAIGSLDLAVENDLFVKFLRHHWSSMHGVVRERELYKSIKNQIGGPQQAVEYSEQLVNAAKLYRAIEEPSDSHWTQDGFSHSTRINVQTLLSLELEQYRPLMLAVLDQFSIREQERTIRALVSWAVRGLIVGGIGGGRAERVYCDAAVEIRGEAVATTDALLGSLAAIVPDDQSFESAFRQARQTKPRIARYLQLALQRTDSGTHQPELVPNENADEVNLEHILPKNADEDDWPSFNRDQRAIWVHRLGNHCLLKKDHNGALGNKPWSEKRAVLGDSELSLTASCSANEDWTTTEIELRQKELATLALTTWPRTQ